MPSNVNCPVCNKAGLQDYTLTPTVCPQCNSDLKPYLILNTIAKRNSNKTPLFALIGVAIVACAFAIFYFNSLSDKKQIVDDNSKAVKQLQDSMGTLQTSFVKSETTQSENKSSEKEIAIQYKVKSGDYPSKIARFFYNDWKMYKKIEADNNLKQPYILKAGQLLTIKISQ